MPHLVWMARDDGVVEYVNSRIENYAGVTPGADGKWGWDALIHPDDLPGTEAAWTTAASAHLPYEFEHRMRMADGTYRWHLSRAVAVQDEDGWRWYGTATDIHASRMAAEELARTQQSLALAMRGGRMGWWARDLVTDAVAWSPELEEIFGFPRGGFGGDVRSFRELIVEADRAVLEAAVARALATGDDYVVEFRYVHADGTIRWMEGRGRATYEGDQPRMLFGLGMDITERKHAEELRDMFIGMLSHELRTPVTAIYAGGQLLLKPGLDPATRDEVTADIVAEGERLERMVENLLVLARAERNALSVGDEPVVLRPLAMQVATTEERRKPGARITVEIPLGLPPVRGDAASIELALRNLLSNALKYGGGEGRVTLRATATADLDVIEVRVLDDGPGFGEADTERAFDLFYRAPSAVRTAPGAGIGLYVVRSLIGSMGGTTWARNRPEGGAELGFALRRYTEETDGASGQVGRHGSA